MNKTINLNCHVIASSRSTDMPNYIENNDDIVYCKFGEEKKAVHELDYIIHCAAPTSNKFFISNPVETLNVIIDGTKNMLELTKDKNCKMIYISSEEVYGSAISDQTIDESFVGSIDSLNIRSCYPLGKKITELMCKSYKEEYGVAVNILRPTVILGLWQPYDSVKVECEILRCIIENKNLVMKSDGTTKKSVIYSLDCVAAIFTVLLKGTAGEAYNATNPDTFSTVKDRAYQAFIKYNPNITIEFMTNNKNANGYLPKRELLEDISKIRKLGWKPLADMNYIYDIDLRRFQNARGIKKTSL